MSMETELLAALLADSGLSALVGARINWDLRPQATTTLPAITLTVISGVPDRKLDGARSVVPYRVQADVWGASVSQAKSVRDALIAFEGYAGGGIQGVFVGNERDLTDTTTPDVIFNPSIDLMVHYRP